MTPLQEQLMLTLSHFEPMTLDKIFIDLDSHFVENHPELSLEDVNDSLAQLVQLNKVKCIEESGHKQWIKKFPKRKKWWQRLFIF